MTWKPGCIALATAVLSCVPLSGCVERETDSATTAPATPMVIESHPHRRAYFGDLHVHTLYSFDAFIYGARADPDDAYRYARGETLRHPAGFDMTLTEPLDFQAVTDHAEYLGMAPAMADPDSPVGAHAMSLALRDARTVEQRIAHFVDMLPYLFGWGESDDLYDPRMVRAAWDAIVDAAERHNDPGVFTTFAGFEYTTSSGMAENLHRNVIFRGSAVPDMPFSPLDSPNPEHLWAWMDGLRALGFEALAIPHNSNASNGAMFANTDLSGAPVDATYSDQRMRNEPLVEVTQVKGTSDTHPALSPNDEWADFEIVPHRIDFSTPSQPRGGYVREAYRNGLAMERELGSNPYRFGLIGSSDSHTGAGSFREGDYWGKTALMDGTPGLRASVPPDPSRQAGGMPGPFPAQYWGASGLAGVWAKSNTREAIYDAMRRKETFATSGPRIRVRFFAGHDIDASLLESRNTIADAYAKGVPMGGDLAGGSDAAPGFFVWAMGDPRSAPLQRLQIIKGWEEDGATFEQVFDVACSNGSPVNPETHRCADNGATVDIATCTTSPDRGAAELSALWKDPRFQPGQSAFYYARVLENPKCRWSSWDAMRAGVEPRADLPATIQDRAWSSPIWIRGRQGVQ